MSIKTEIPEKRRRTCSSDQRSAPTEHKKDEFKATLNEYRKQGYLCDFVIEIPKFQFRAHRCVLAARSKSFQDLFKTAPNGIRWDSLEKDGVENCLNYMYTGDYKINSQVAEATLIAADVFKLPELKIRFLRYFTSKIDASNCIVIGKIATKVKDQVLQNKAEEMIRKNLEDILEKDKFFHAISKTDLKRLISIQTNPLTMQKAILKWVQHPHNIQRRPEMLDIIETINYDAVSPEELFHFKTEMAKLGMKRAADYIGKKIISRYKRGKLVVAYSNWKILRDIFKDLKEFELARGVNQFVIDNLAEISRQESFSEIGKVDLIYFLKSRKTPWSEEWQSVVWSVVMRWIKFSRSRRNFVPEILKAIDLANFSIEFLQSVVKQEEIIMRDNESLQILVNTLCQIIKK